MFKFKLELLILSLILCQISARQYRVSQHSANRHKREADAPQLTEKARIARDPDCLIKTAHTHESNGQVRIAQLENQVKTEQAQPNIIALEQANGQMVAVEQLPSGKFRTSGLIDQLSEGIAHGLSTGLSTGISSGITNSVYALPDAIAGTLNNLKNPNYGSYSQTGHISEGISSLSSGPYPVASYGSYSSSPVYSESYNSYSSPVHSTSYGSYSSGPANSATYGSFSSSPVYSAPSYVHASYVQQKPASPPFHWDCKLIPASHGNKLVFKDASEGGMQEQVENLSQLIQNGDYLVRSSNEPMGDVQSLRMKNQPMRDMDSPRMSNQPMGLLVNSRMTNQPMEFVDISPRMRMNNQPMAVSEKMNNQPMGIMIDPKMNTQPKVVMEKMSQSMGMMDSSKTPPMMAFYHPNTMEMTNQQMAVMEKINNQPMGIMIDPKMNNQPMGIMIDPKMNIQPMGFVDMSKSPPMITFLRPNMEMPENQLNESMLRDLEKQKNLALLEEMNMSLPPLGMIDPSKLVPPPATPSGNVMVMFIPVMDRNQMPPQATQSHVQSGDNMSSALKPKASEQMVDDERENFIEQNGEN